MPNNTLVNGYITLCVRYVALYFYASHTLHEV